MNILMVLTSHGQLGETGKETGLWLEELATPYYLFKRAGANVTFASPAGGRVPIDPNSEQPDKQTEATRRFRADADAMQALARTQKMADLDPEAFDAVFYAGGHGPLWDLAEDDDSLHLIETFYADGKPVAAVCHGAAALRDARGPFGLPLVRGKDVTGFSNSEERAAGLAEVVPFLVEDALKEAGGRYSKASDWQAHVVTSGNLITGQNPASSVGAAKALLQQLQQHPAQAA
ncbi:MAG TPA: type 1 glutamine amidotransferase domain-containing protein [Rhodanobacteraceae bacterium]|nr:type 1 glutamine amidotransferase domain-containing protein [Rhodanobacteraceae bacterium]